MGPWIEALLEKSRERKLGEIAAGYAVAGWLVVQVASIALPTYEAPAWLLRWLIAAVVLGFPVALACGWIWNRSVAVSVPLGRRDALFLALLAGVGVVTLGELAWHWSSQRSTATDVTSLAVPGSIAVLPFTDTGPDPSQKYLGEGVADELIGLLARNGALRVAARTSSFSFEGKDEDIRAIAQKLNVRAVLEGSVRTDRGRVRIEATLVNGANGYQMWSQSYDRDLSNVLQLQADIAAAIAQSLAPELLERQPQPNIPAPRSIDPDAYRMYLEGQFYFTKRSDEDVARALELFRQVATLSPDFADGQAALAYALLIERARHDNSAEFDGQIHEAVARALAFDPTNPQALTVRIGDAQHRGDWNAVLASALVLKRSNRHSAIGLHGLFLAYQTFGLHEMALNAERESARLDPLSVTARRNIVDVLVSLGRSAEVSAAIRDVLALNPEDRPNYRPEQCEADSRMGRFADAQRILKELSASKTTAGDKEWCDVMLAGYSGHGDVARALANDMAEHFQTKGFEFSALDIAQAFAVAGELDRAMDWFERALAARAPDFFNYDHSPDLPPKLFMTARWIALTQRPEYQAWQQVRARAIKELADSK